MANGDTPAPRIGRGVVASERLGDASAPATSSSRRPAMAVAVEATVFESFVPSQCPPAGLQRRARRGRTAEVADSPVGLAPLPESPAETDAPSVAGPSTDAPPSEGSASGTASPESAVRESAASEGAAPGSAAPESAAPESAPQYAAPEGAVVAILDVMSRAQGGDPAAFGELYDHYVDLVYRYIYYRVGSAATAEDLTSETFLRALRRISSFTWQGRDPGAWFVTIARNLVADHYKSGRYRFEVTTADMLDAGADRPQDSPEGEVLDAITHATLLEAVKRLNAEQQECIVLRFLQGFSVAETARAMSKNEGAIKALQYRAVRTLGRLLPAGLSAPERA